MQDENCPFCGNGESMLTSNEDAFAVSDKRPLSRGHTLIVARRHMPTIFELPPTEYAACFELLRQVKEIISREQRAEAFNVVVNCGAEAGQAVPHAHIHLVPRYRDTPLSASADSWSTVV